MLNDTIYPTTIPFFYDSFRFTIYEMILAYQTHAAHGSAI